MVDAAKRTGAHEMILGLPDGYDFQVSAGGAALSGGQRQRIALARAFYGSPVVVVMDEPDSNLDAEGTMALSRAVEGHKKRGGTAVIVAHRHGAFAQCDTVYLMEAGRPVPATSGRGAAPVRSLQSAGDRRAGGGPPAAGPAVSTRDEPEPAAKTTRRADTGTAGGARDARRTRAAPGRPRAVPRPVVTVVRGGRKAAQSSGGAKPAPPAQAPGAGPPRADSGPVPGTADRPVTSARDRRIAAAVARVRGSRSSKRRAGAAAAVSEPIGSAGASGRRTRRDDAS